MSCSLYGEAIYGSSEYGGVCSDRYFRYQCGLQVNQGRYFRYGCLAAIFNSRYFRYACTAEIESPRKFRYYPNGVIAKDRKFRYLASQGIVQSRKFRYATNQGIRNEKRFRYSNSRTMSDRKFRYSVVVPVNKDRRIRYLPLSSTYEVVSGGNPSGNPSSGGGGTLGFPYVNPLQGYLYATSTQIPETHDLGLASFGVTFKESQPAQWALNIMDPTGKYNPENTASAWYQKMDDDPYTGGVLTKWVRSALTYGDQPFYFIGVPTQYNYSRQSNTRYFSFTWSGVDKSEQLFKNGSTYATYKSRLGSNVTAHQIITAILADNGFNAIFSFPDFVVPIMHLQNSKPIEFCKSLMEVMGAEWILEGENTIHMYLPTQKTGNHNWTIDLSSNTNLCWEHSVDSQFPEIYNQVTISRTREVGISTPQAEDGEGNEMTVDEFGVYTIDFNTPLNGLYYRVLEQVKGNFNTLEMYNPEDVLIGVLDDVGGAHAPSFRQSTGYNVKKVVFNWDANAGILAAEGFGRIRFFGSTNDSYTGSSTDVVATSEFDTAFTIVARYEASISKHGLKPIELPPNPLIPTSAVAQIAATEYLRRVFRSRKTIKYKVPLNFMIKVGDTIREIDNSLSLTRNVYIVEVSHNFSNNPTERFSVITCVEYPTDFAVTFSDGAGGTPAGALGYVSGGGSGGSDLQIDFVDSGIVDETNIIYTGDTIPRNRGISMWFNQNILSISNGFAELDSDSTPISGSWEVWANTVIFWHSEPFTPAYSGEQVNFGFDVQALNTAGGSMTFGTHFIYE